MFNDVIEMLNQNYSHNKISNELGIKIDRVKKISQLNNMYLKMEKLECSIDLINKIKKLELKALAFNKLIRKNEIDAIISILCNIDIITVRKSEIENMVNNILYKMKEQEAKLLKYEKSIEILNNNKFMTNKNDYILDLELIKNIYLDIDEDIFLGVSDEAKKFILECVGISKGKFVLAKKIEQKWSLSLKNKKIIIYNSSKYIWEINDIYKFIDSVENRIEKKYKMYYYDSSFFKESNDKEMVKQDVFYKKVKPLIVDIYDYYNSTSSRELRKNNIDIIKYRDKIESVSNKSDRNIKEHRLVQESILKNFHKLGYVGITDISYEKSIFDTIIYNEEEIVIFEVKVNREDFLKDNKLIKYIKYSNKVYIAILNTIITQAVSMKLKKLNKQYGIGTILVAYNDNKKEYDVKKIIYEANYNNIDINLKRMLEMKIGNKLTTKFLYGF